MKIVTIAIKADMKKLALLSRTLARSRSLSYSFLEISNIIDAVSKEVSDYVLNIIEEYLNILNNNEAKCSKQGKEVILKTLFELLEDAKLDPYNPEKIIGK